MKATVLLVRRGDETIVSPSVDEVVQVGDVLVPYGRDDELERLLNEARRRYPDEGGEK